MSSGFRLDAQDTASFLEQYFLPQHGICSSSIGMKHLQLQLSLLLIDSAAGDDGGSGNEGQQGSANKIAVASGTRAAAGAFVIFIVVVGWSGTYDCCCSCSTT